MKQRSRRFGRSSPAVPTGCTIRPGQDTTYTSLSVPYFSHGYSIGGTSKDFVYDPGLKDHPDGHITEHGDLNEIYRRAYNDTTLYKRIKGDWYICLEHDN